MANEGAHKYLGKKVLIEGLIIDVCAARGGQKMRHLSLTSLGIIIPIAFLFWI